MNLAPFVSSASSAIDELERQLADPMSAAALSRALRGLQSQGANTDAQVAQARQAIFDMLSQPTPEAPAPKALRDVTSDEERKWLPIVQFLGNALSRSGMNPGTQAVQGYVGAKQEDLERQNKLAQEQYARGLAERERLLRAHGLKLEGLEGDRRDLRAREDRLRSDLFGAQRQQELAQDRATDNERQAVSVLNQVKFPSQVRATAKTLKLDLSEDQLKAIEKDIATRNSESARNDYARLVTQVWSNSASDGMTDANKRLLESMRKALAVQYGVPESTFAGVWTGVTGQSERALMTLASKAADRKQRSTEFNRMMEHRRQALAQAKDLAGLRVAAETARVYAAIDERARQFDTKLAQGYFDKDLAKMLDKDKAAMKKKLSDLQGKLAGAEAKARASGLSPDEVPGVAAIREELKFWRDQLAAVDEDTAAARAEELARSATGYWQDGVKYTDSAKAADAARANFQSPTVSAGSQRLDIGKLRQAALQAIKAGKDGAAVRARFKQLTGQDL